MVEQNLGGSDVRSIRVAVRVRPAVNREDTSEGDSSLLSHDEHSVCITTLIAEKRISKRYAFDDILGPDVTQVCTSL